MIENADDDPVLFRINETQVPSFKAQLEQNQCDVLSKNLTIALKKVSINQKGLRGK